MLTNPTTIAALPQHIGSTVTLEGWLYNLRSSGKLLFPTFRDGTGTVQGIVPKAAVSEALFTTLKELQLESSLTVTGTVRADDRAPSGVELDVHDLHVLSAVDPARPFPISLKEHGVDFLMEHRHLWIRTPRQSAILRVRATIMRAAAEFFDTSGFIRTDPPILTPNACEGTSELFEMDYFDDDKAYLTQSGQLYIEATALALGKVYSFGPTFRAEKSKTRRHLTEFWMIEPEVAFLELEGLLQLAEDFLIHIVTTVLHHHRADLKVIGRDLAKLEAVLAPNDPTPDTPTPESCHPEQSEGPASLPQNPKAAIAAGAPGSAVSSPNLGSSATNPSGQPHTAGAPLMTASPSWVGSSSGSPESHAEGDKTPRSGFPRLSYDQAHAMLEDAFARGLIETQHIYGDDFGSPDETYLSSQFTKPVLVHRYPAAIKAFYMQPDPADPAKALCVDVLAPEGYGEIIGGSQRIHDYDLLKSRIEHANLPLAPFQWYLDLRRYGSVPHSGFGMGIERAVAWICGLDHVRETIPFARTLNRIYP